MTETLSAESSGDIQETTPEQRLVKDFYLSFKFSQGSPPIHELLFKQLSNFYHEHLPQTDMLWITANRQHLYNRFRALRPPRQHRVTERGIFNPNASAERKQEGASAEFGTQARALLDKVDEGPSIGSKHLRNLAHKLVERDTDFTVKKRGYMVADDPFRSYFREYVVLQNPTGSEAFDEIFRKMLDESTRAHIFESSTVTDLEAKWEHRHPGESFFPVDAAM